MFDRRIAFMLLLSLLAIPFALASPVEIEVRQSSSNTCSLPKIQSLLQALAKQYPKAAVNSFCSSVVPASERPRTTVRTTTTQTVSYTIVDTYSITVRCLAPLPLLSGPMLT